MHDATSLHLSTCVEKEGGEAYTKNEGFNKKVHVRNFSSNYPKHMSSFIKNIYLKFYDSCKMLSHGLGNDAGMHIS